MVVCGAAGKGGGHTVCAEKRLLHRLGAAAFLFAEGFEGRGLVSGKTGEIRREHGGRYEEENCLAGAGICAGARAAAGVGDGRVAQLPGKREQHGHYRRADTCA